MHVNFTKTGRDKVVGEDEGEVKELIRHTQYNIQGVPPKNRTDVF